MALTPKPLPSAAHGVVRRIRVRLAELGRTDADLAAELGISRVTLAGYLRLRGRTTDPAAWGSKGGAVSLETIADALGVDVEQLTG